MIIDCNILNKNINNLYSKTNTLFREKTDQKKLKLYLEKHLTYENI